jgi:hypothetical protein
VSTLLHFGAFDHDNYGDLLFPLLVENRLKDHGWSAIHISYSGRATPWKDARPSLMIQDFMPRWEECGAVIIGGGDIILSGSWSPFNEEVWETAAVLPSLWLGASEFARSAQVPLLWNAPGVPLPFPRWASPYVREVLKSSSYVSTRDIASQQILKGLEDLFVADVPDTAFDLPSLWTAGDLRPIWLEFNSENILFGERGYIAVFVSSSRKIDPEMGDRLRRLAEHLERPVVLVEISPWQTDNDFTASLLAALGNWGVLLERPTSLQQMTAILAGSSLYIGDSLHGSIASTSYGTPSIVVEGSGRANHKYREAAEKMGGLCSVVNCWSEALELAKSLILRPCVEPSFTAPTELAATRQAVEEHWRSLIDCLNNAGGCPAKGDAVHLLPARLIEYGISRAQAEPFENEAQIFFPNHFGKYDEACSLRRAFSEPNQWIDWAVDIDSSEASSNFWKIRLDPSCRPGLCFVEVSGNSGQVDAKSIPMVLEDCGGTARLIGSLNGQAVVLSFGNDPQMFFSLPREKCGGSLKVTAKFIWAPFAGDKSLAAYESLPSPGLEVGSLTSFISLLAEQRSHFIKSLDRPISWESATLLNLYEQLVRAQLKVLWKKISIPPSQSLASPVDFLTPDEITDLSTQTKLEAIQRSLDDYIIRTKSLDDLFVKEKQRARELEASNLSMQKKSEAIQRSLDDYIIRTKSLDDLFVKEKQRARELEASNLSMQKKSEAMQRSMDDYIIRTKSLDDLLVQERQRAGELEDILTRTNLVAECQLDEYEREIETVKIEKKKIQETADFKIANLKASLSWRLTAPLRFIRDNGMQIWKKSTQR